MSYLDMNNLDQKQNQESNIETMKTSTYIDILFKCELYELSMFIYLSQ